MAYLDTRVAGDHKALWEPNRHQYLYGPALCWLLYRRREDFDLIERHLASWLDENPFRVGVNWASSLEVAYRAITWCWLFRLLSDAPWSAPLVVRLKQSLAQHASHVERYLSTYFSPNTHLTGEALGLFYVGTVLPEVNASTRWRTSGARILESALAWQVRQDGTYFEQATQYHRYTTEIYLHYLRLAESSGYPVGADVRRRLSGLFDVLRSIADGRGRIPLLGDDDGGLLLPLDHRTPDDVRGLLLAGGVALGRPELVPADAPPVTAAALCGYRATELMLRGTRSFPAWTDREFQDGGLLVIRDGWSESDAIAVIDGGPHGALNCGHAHSDALSLTLSLGGSSLFIDRGTFTYTGERRNEFRATGSHNTVEIDATSTATPTTPFAWLSVPPVPKSALREVGPVRWVYGSAVGHLDSGRPSRHRRTVLHVASGPWVVVDQVERSGGFDKAEARWYLHPDCEPERRDEWTYDVLVSGSPTPLARVEALVARELSVENRDVSLRLGNLRPSKLLACGADHAGRIVTVVTPWSEVRQSSCCRSDAGGSWTWRDGAHTHEIVFRAAAGSSWIAFGLSSEAVLGWRILRGAGDGSMELREWVVLVGARDVTSSSGRRFVSPGDPDLPGVMVLERCGSDWCWSAAGQGRSTRE